MSIPSWAVKGAKVVYVGHPSGKTASDFGFTCNKMTRGAIYTIREISSGMHSGPLPDETSGLRLEELVLSGTWPSGRKFTDAWLSVLSFRPVKTIEDDISEHFAIFLRTPSKVDA